MFELLLLVTALSVDTFAAAFSYGVSKIRIPPFSLLIVSAISSLVLMLSMLAGLAASCFLPIGLAKELSFLVLFVIGLVKLFDRSRHQEAEEANKNQDDLLSSMEALVLGAVLSVDCAVAGLGAGTAAEQIPAAFFLSLLISMLTIAAGSSLGRLISARSRSNLCWVSGVLLILLAFMKFF